VAAFYRANNTVLIQGNKAQAQISLEGPLQVVVIVIIAGPEAFGTTPESCQFIVSIQSHFGDAIFHLYFSISLNIMKGLGIIRPILVGQII
jgi:hypothetical protein